MTVKELRELLAKYPDDLPIAYQLHSEWTELAAIEIAPGELFDNGGYLSSPYDDRGRALAKPYLLFPGN